MGKTMTIDSNTSQIRYVGNGVTTHFSVPFPYLTNVNGTAQLAVYIGDSDIPLIEKEDYTIEGISNNQPIEAAYEDRFDEGTVIFKTAPEEGVPIAVVRRVPQTQSTVFIEGSKFPAKDFENGLDKLTMEIQELYENLSRAIVLPPTSTENPLVARDNILKARDEAVQSSYEALKAVSEANKTLVEVREYTDQAILDVNSIVETATTNIDSTINEAVEDVKAAAIAVANEAIQDAANTAIQIATDHANTVIIPPLQEYVDNARESATSAEESSLSASASASSASQSASNALTSETNAKASEVNAKNSEQVLKNLLPTQASNAGKYLTTDGTNAQWSELPPTTTITYWDE